MDEAEPRNKLWSFSFDITSQIIKASLWYWYLEFVLPEVAFGKVSQ